MKTSIQSQHLLNGTKISNSIIKVHFEVLIFSMSALYEASYLSKLNVCLFLFLWQRQLATQLGNCSCFAQNYCWEAATLLRTTFPKPLSVPDSCILVCPPNSSLWNVINPFQNEIKCKIHNPPQIGLFFGQLNTVYTTGGSEESLVNLGTTRGRKEPVGQH